MMMMIMIIFVGARLWVQVDLVGDDDAGDALAVLLQGGFRGCYYDYYYDDYYYYYYYYFYYYYYYFYYYYYYYYYYY